METQFFRFSLVYPVVYAPIFLFLVIPGSRVPVDWVIVPLHLVCMVCLFSLLYFVSKNSGLRKQESPRHSTNMRLQYISCGFPRWRVDCPAEGQSALRRQKRHRGIRRARLAKS